jgi:hypothetical protein
MTTKTARLSAAERKSLKKAYLFVVNNFAVSTADVAKALKVDTKEAKRLLDGLGSLVEGTHVNQERELTWQSYYDIENSDPKETLASANADFDAAFPVGAEIPAAKKGASGPAIPRPSLRRVATRSSPGRRTPRSRRRRVSSRRTTSRRRSRSATPL